MKTLGILILIIALPLSWVAWEIDKVRRFEQTVQEFDERGIEVDKESDVLVLDAFPSPWKQRHVRTLNISELSRKRRTIQLYLPRLPALQRQMQEMEAGGGQVDFAESREAWDILGAVPDGYGCHRRWARTPEEPTGPVPGRFGRKSGNATGSAAVSSGYAELPRSLVATG